MAVKKTRKTKNKSRIPGVDVGEVVELGSAL